MIERAPALSTDLYELTMAAAYFDNGLLRQRAIFELFARSLPRRRSYLITAGLDQVLDYLTSLRFTPDQVDFLREHPSFDRVSREFFEYLEEFSFTGEVWAMPEGTAAFPMEPIIRISAPVIEAQIIETFLLTTVNFQTLVATKAARVVTAAGGRSVIEFGTRRAHGSEAGLYAARAAYIAGCAGTSNVEAGYVFGIPTFGTLAHSFVMLFGDEADAFRAFLKVFPRTATILVDTYDTIAAVERLAREFGPSVPSVRLDSGDLLDLSIRVRQILDEAGMTGTKIFASSDLNEDRVADLIARGAKIDSFGVGTQLATSYDAPALTGVYKLVGTEADGKLSMKIKMSPDKATYPGPKQVWRLTDEAGKYTRDIIALSDEEPPRDLAARSGATAGALLELVMKDGRPVEEMPDLNDTTRVKRESRHARLIEARERAGVELRRLPSELIALDGAASYPVEFSSRLIREKEKLGQAITARQS